MSQVESAVRKLATGLALALLTTVPALTQVAQEPTSRETLGVALGPTAFRPVTEAEHSRSRSAATAVAVPAEVTSSCSETQRRTAEVVLRWQRAAGDQRAQISKLREGFAVGTYETTEDLAAAVESVTLVGAEPGIRYYWRIVNLTADGGLSAGPVGRFEAPICVADGGER